jgi:hypothetical protein
VGRSGDDRLVPGQEGVHWHQGDYGPAVLQASFNLLEGTRDHSLDFCRLSAGHLANVSIKQWYSKVVV